MLANPQETVRFGGNIRVGVGWAVMDVHKGVSTDGPDGADGALTSAPAWRNRPDELQSSGTLAAFISLMSHLPLMRTSVSLELVCAAIFPAALSTYRHSK